MTTLISPADVRALVATDIEDSDLLTIIEREEAMLVKACGAHEGPITETIVGGGVSLFVSRPIASISSISERTTLTSDSTTLATTLYYPWASEGRIERMSSTWGALVSVTYTPVDDRPERKAVLIELVRIALERTAMQREDLRGARDGYSYTAPDWERARKRLYRRLGFMRI